jgi:hypothetical protein
MDKFGRTYRLEVQTALGTTLVVEPPFTIQFDVFRNLIVSPNVSTIRVFNLSQNNRNQVRYDVSNYGELRPVVLKAGYVGQTLATIFSGNIAQAWSVREGTDFVTTIQAHDGGFSFVNGKTDNTFPKNTEFSTVIKTLAGQNLPGVTLGAVGDYPGQLTRGNAYSGTTSDILTQITSNGFFIDNTKAHCLNPNECVEGGLPVINSKSGLLGTPVRENLIIHFEMLFEPRLIIAQQVKLESIGDVNFNGFYKIYSLHHKGMISESVCGEAITEVVFNYGNGALANVKSAT